MIDAFTSLLRRIAAELGQFSEPETGSLTWNGTAYSAGRQGKLDPYAAKWWATLIAIAEMMERQGTSPSHQQKVYLDRLLFGGMGSFNDFMVDEQRVGAAAKQANQELNTLRKALFSEFQRL